MNKIVFLGNVNNSKGLKGHLRVTSLANLKMLKGRVIIKKGIIKTLYTIENIEKESEDKYIVKLLEINDINEAKELAASKLYISKKDLMKIYKDVILPELIDMEVMDKNNHYVGMITDILNNVAYYSLLIQENETRFIVPFIQEFINNIDREDEKIKLNIENINEFKI